MEVLKKNKGLIIFYLCIIMFSVFMVTNVDRNNDKMLTAKNESVFSDNLS